MNAPVNLANMMAVVKMELIHSSVIVRLGTLASVVRQVTTIRGS